MKLDIRNVTPLLRKVFPWQYTINCRSVHGEVRFTMSSGTVQTDSTGHSPDEDPKPDSTPSKKDDAIAANSGNSEAEKQDTLVSSQITSSGSTPRKISKNLKPLNGIASKLGYTPGISPRGKAGPTMRTDAYAFGSKVASTSSESTTLPFLMDSIYTDTVLVVEGKRFYIHRSLLGYASEYFQKLFATAHAASGEKSLRVKPEVVIKDKSYSDILELLAFYHPGVIRDLTGIEMHIHLFLNKIIF